MPSESTSTPAMIDLFLKSEVRRAREIMRSPGHPARRFKSLHVGLKDMLRGKPMERIDAATQQENDLSYMAYRLEHIANIATNEDLEDK